jgi:hypothetical protein
MRRALTLVAVAAAIAASGCGRDAGDLIAIEISGGPQPGKTTLVVTQDGRGTCNGSELRQIESETLIEARKAERELEPLLEDGAEFPGPEEGRRTYVVRTKAGSVRWVEGTPGLPRELPETARLALQLERELCR